MNVNLSKYSSLVIYGLGKSGISCLKFLISQGYSNIFATDDNSDTIFRVKELFKQEFDNLEAVFIDPLQVSSKIDDNSKVIFAPGIPLYYPKRHFILDVIKDSNLICDIEIFNEIFLQDNICNIGVTGTNGKSTICSIINHILLNLDLKSFLVGNIGLPIFDVFDQINSKGEGEDCLVTEISSFQLDLVKNTGFNIAAISNISDDHIERHGSFENYLSSKLRIFKNSAKDDFLIVNDDDSNLREFCNKVAQENKDFKIVKTSSIQEIKEGISVVNNNLSIKIFGFDLQYDVSDMIIRGKHNQENCAIAIACVLSYLKKINLLTENLINKAIKSLLLFPGIKHRMQFLGIKNNIKFINDSKATNPVSVNFALNSYDNISLIIGGYDKGSDFDVMKESLHKVRKFYVIGKSYERLEKFLKKNDVKYEICFNLEEAFNKSVNDADKLDRKDSVVMLSPACASFDQWRSFEERGDYFCKLFNEIK